MKVSDAEILMSIAPSSFLLLTGSQLAARHQAEREDSFFFFFLVFFFVFFLSLIDSSIEDIFEGNPWECVLLVQSGPPIPRQGTERGLRGSFNWAETSESSSAAPGSAAACHRPHANTAAAKHSEHAQHIHARLSKHTRAHTHRGAPALINATPPGRGWKRKNSRGGF